MDNAVSQSGDDSPAGLECRSDVPTEPPFSQVILKCCPTAPEGFPSHPTLDQTPYTLDSISASTRVRISEVFAVIDSFVPKSSLR